MPQNQNNEVTQFAKSNYRNRRVEFGIKQKDRLYHSYIIGKTGTGKTTLLETMMLQDVEMGNGFAFLDPHGDLAEKLNTQIPGDKKENVIYLNVFDQNNRYSFNPLANVSVDKRTLAASGLLDGFKRIWAENWGPRLEHLLRNALLALMEVHEASFADILRLIHEKPYRQSIAKRVSNPQVRHYWLKEFEGYPAGFRNMVTSPLENKVGAFLANPYLYESLTRSDNSFNFREIMDSSKIVIVNLAKGKIGEDASSLLGALLVSQISIAALSRADIPEDERKNFFVYLDEFHNYANSTLVTMLSELRKYHVGMILAHQYTTQLTYTVKDALLGNAGTLITFRVGISDAEYLRKEFYPHFIVSDLINLPNYHIYLKLMIDGTVSHPFSAETIKIPH